MGKRIVMGSAAFETPAGMAVTPPVMAEAWRHFTVEEQTTITRRCSGKSQREIAGEDFVSVFAVQKRYTRILQRLGLAGGTDGRLMDQVCWAHGYNTALDDVRRKLGSR